MNGFYKVVSFLRERLELNENVNTVFSASEIVGLFKNTLIGLGYNKAARSTIAAWIKYFVLKKQLERSGNGTDYLIIRSNSIPKRKEGLGFLQRLGLADDK